MGEKLKSFVMRMKKQKNKFPSKMVILQSIFISINIILINFVNNMEIRQQFRETFSGSNYNVWQFNLTAFFFGPNLFNLPRLFLMMGWVQDVNAPFI